MPLLSIRIITLRLSLTLTESKCGGTVLEVAKERIQVWYTVVSESFEAN
jgi:hypothetical protein